MIGARIRALREESGATQDQLARALARHGVVWTRARVGQVERGDANLDLTTAFAVTLALSELIARDVRLAELLPVDDESDDVCRLRDALRGEPVRGPVIARLWDPRLSPGWGPVEDRVLEEVGVEFGAVVLNVAKRLYGRTATEERDRRAGADANPQRRGAMGRSIVKELVAATQREIDESAGQDAEIEAAVRRGGVQWVDPS
ncbi:hypothetical protein TPB0596_42070 [Tsukamurella pulmonis]|nr:hypothetical protein TPB0596_42070 [Tsukamurella pulmonis]